MKKIILFSTISVLLSACGGGSGRDASFEHDPKPVVNSVKLSTGQTIQLRGTGVITSVDPNTTVNADAAGTVLNNAIQGRTYAGGYATDSSYAFVETNNMGNTSIPKFDGHVADVPTTGKANYAGEMYALTQYYAGHTSAEIARSVNSGVASGSVRFEADFANKTLSGGTVEPWGMNVAHGTQGGKEIIPVTKSDGTIEDKEKETLYHAREYVAYKLDNVSFNDLKAGTAPVTVTERHTSETTYVGESRTGERVTKIDFHTGKAKGNFYGANAKDLAGSVKLDDGTKTEYDAAFHTRKQ